MPDGQIPYSRIFFSSIGMSIVALICAIAGLIYGANGAVGPEKIPYAIGYWILIYPYFLSRYASVEVFPPDPQRLADLGRFLPAAFLAAFLALFLSLSALLTLLRSADHFWTTWLAWIGLTLLAAAPFAFLGATAQLRLLSVRTSEEELLFKNKVLIPALATCLVSFAFGWTMYHPSWYVLGLVLPAALIVVFRMLVAARRMPWIIAAVLVAIAASFTGTLVATSTTEQLIGKVVLTGFTLTFAMGVAEVCKRVVWFHQGRQRPVGQEDERFYEAGSNWSSVLFPILLFLLPVLIYELPVWLVFLVIAAQYVHWHFFTPRRTSPWLVAVNVFLGVSLPVVLSLQYFLHFTPTIFPPSQLSDTLTLLTLTVAAGSFLVPAFFPRWRRFLRHRIWNRDTYLNYDDCFLFFLAVEFGVALLIVLVVDFAAPAQPEIRAKASETILGLIVLCLMALGFYTTRRQRMIARASPSGPQSDEDTTSGARWVMIDRRLVPVWLTLVWDVARLPIGIVSALPVALTLAFTSELAWPIEILHSLVIGAITMAGFVHNDIFDITKDRQSRRPKPIAAKVVALPAAGAFGAFLMLFGLSTAAVISTNGSFYVAGAAAIGVGGYSLVAARIPVLKGMITAVLCCSPFAYVAQVASVHVPLSSYICISSFIVGRELLLDVRDFASDQKAMIPTLVAYLNPPVSRTVGWGLMFGSAFVVIALSQGIAKLLSAVAAIILVGCLILYLHDENRGLAWSRIALFLGVGGIAFGLQV